MSFAPVQVTAMKAESLPVLGFWKDGDSFVPTQAAADVWSAPLIESLRSSGLFPSQKGEMLTVPPCSEWPLDWFFFILEIVPSVHPKASVRWYAPP